MEQKFLTTFSKYTQPDDILVLAVSGGVDSMVLFDVVIRNHLREKIIIAHFDHSLRGVESDGDREFIANICNIENIVFEFEKMDIALSAKNEKMSIEAVARKYRYEFLTRIAEKYSARYILTAHHQDDRIETAMFHLIRGTKLGGIRALSFLSSRRGLFQN
jgi:tRNA(Ile)-lysidine synthase